jgi:hypothetical protein
MLNNRELASVILIGIALVAAITQRELRESIGDFAKQAFASKLLLLWVIYAGAIGSAEYGLIRAGLHYKGSIKDAVAFALIAGLPIYLKFDAAATNPGLLRRAIFGTLRAAAVVEFFVNLYVFPLWVELLLQVVLIALGVLNAFAEVEKSVPKEVRGCLSWLASISGLALIVVVAVHLGTHWSDIEWRVTGLSFLHPIALTPAAVGATTVVMYLAAYEEALGYRLRYPRTDLPPRAIHRVALLVGLHLHVRKVKGFAGAVSVRLRQTQSLRQALAVVHAYRDGRITPADWPGLADDDVPD